MYKAQWHTRHTDSNGMVDFHSLKAVAKQLATLFRSYATVIGILAQLKREGQVYYKHGSSVFECWRVMEYKEPDDFKNMSLAQIEALADEQDETLQ